MRLPALLRTALVLSVAVSLFAPAAGCGGAKKPKKGMTIAKRLEKARGEKSPDGKARELTKVARSQFKSGDKSGAVKTLTEAKDLLPADSVAVVSGPRLIEIADVLAEMEEGKLARESLKRAIEMSGRIDDTISRIRLLADAGAIYGAKAGGLGDSKAARDVLDSAVDLSGGVEDRFKAQALAAIALGYATAGLADDAGKVVEELEASAKGLEDPRPKAEALAAAARVRVQTGAKDAAAALLEAAAAAAKTIAEKGIAAESRTYALLAVANGYADAGDAKAATGLLKLAEKSAMQVPDPESQKNAIEKVRQAQGELERKK